MEPVGRQRRLGHACARHLGKPPCERRPAKMAAMAAPSIPNLHDAILERVVVDWPAGTALIECRAADARTVLVVQHMREVRVDKRNPGGRASRSTASTWTNPAAARSPCTSRCRAATTFSSLAAPLRFRTPSHAPAQIRSWQRPNRTASGQCVTSANRASTPRVLIVRQRHERRAHAAR